MARNTAIVLAAGQGTRMKSDLPKVLHPVCDVPMVAYPIQAAFDAGCSDVVVVLSPQSGRVRDLLSARFSEKNVRFATQQKPLGTGDAARAGLAEIKDKSGSVLILCGDTPLLRAATLKRLMKKQPKGGLCVLTANVDNPKGYGRIVREGKMLSAIVEEKDASATERNIHEINVGVYSVDVGFLRDALKRINNRNKQGELYLPDIVVFAAARAASEALVLEDFSESLGINDRAQLAQAQTLMRARIIEQHMAGGVTFLDPDNTYVSTQTKIGRDTTIGFGVQLQGANVIGARCRIEGPSVLKDSKLTKGVHIRPFSHCEGAIVEEGAIVGPYARLREETQVCAEAKVGNFVELKKTKLGKGSKANHLTYLGDATIGADVNVGAGTITCNYDGGPVKHRTTLGDGVFIGSNTTLVAPIKLAAGAYAAAGSTLTKNVPKDALAFGRARQAAKAGYAKVLWQRIRAAKKEG